MPSLTRMDAEHLVAAGEIGDAVDDGRRAVHVVLGVDAPRLRPALGVEAIEAAVVGADHDLVGDHDRRRLHFALRLERPRRLAVRDADGVHRAAQIADEDEPERRRHRRRRLADALDRLVAPARLAGRQVQRQQLALLRADVDDAAGNRRRRFHRIARLEGPLHLQGRGHRRRGDAGERGRAAELRPVGAGQRGLGRGRHRRGGDRQQGRSGGGETGASSHEGAPFRRRTWNSSRAGLRAGPSATWTGVTWPWIHSAIRTTSCGRKTWK